MSDRPLPRPPQRYRDMTTSELIEWAISQSHRSQGMLIYALSKRLEQVTSRPQIGKPHLHRMRRLLNGGLWCCTGCGVRIYGKSAPDAYRVWASVIRRPGRHRAQR